MEAIPDLVEKGETGVISSLAAGITKSIGTILTERAKMVSLTCRVKYHGSATTGITLSLYYVHESLGEDTEAFASFVPTLTAGSTVQRTVLVDVPVGGSINLKVKNGDGTYAATDLKVGYSLIRDGD